MASISLSKDDVMNVDDASLRNLNRRLIMERLQRRAANNQWHQSHIENTFYDSINNDRHIEINNYAVKRKTTMTTLQDDKLVSKQAAGIIKIMINASKEAKGSLLEFIERSKMKEDKDNYVEPSDVTTTEYSVVQYGWSAKCKCGLEHCVNSVHPNGKRLNTKICRHADGSVSALFAENAFIRWYQLNDYDSN